MGAKRSMRATRTSAETKKTLKVAGQSRKPPFSSLMSASPQAPSTLVCKYCKNSYLFEVCRKFGSLSTNEKTKWPFAKRIYFSCFGDGLWANRL